MLSTFLRVFLAGQLKPFCLDSKEKPRFDPSIECLGLYLHIPFCRRICPFCPYNKRLYQEDKADQYCRALSLELRRYKEIFNQARINSVYFGGGTPTAITPHVVQLIDEIKGLFKTTVNQIGVEAHPEDLTPDKLESLRNAGVNLLSVGVQTFNSRFLKMIGRNYDGTVAERAVQTACNAGFDTVDVDLLFALPGQEVEDVLSDVATAFALGAQQISTYPLIIFPYTGMDTYVKRLGLKKTGLAAEKKMLEAIVSLAEKSGYSRTSIWTFTRQGATRYSSVTRERFVGIGAGAASLNSGYFYLNTFDVDQYIEVAGKGLPVSVGMKLPLRVEMLYWLYWRMYDLEIPISRFEDLFQESLPSRFGFLLEVLRFSGMVTTNGDSIRLTPKGAYCFHLVEKGHSWDYLGRVWAGALKEPWPSRICF